MGIQPRLRHTATAKATPISWLLGYAAAMVNAGHHGDIARVKAGLLPWPGKPHGHTAKDKACSQG